MFSALSHLLGQLSLYHASCASKRYRCRVLISVALGLTDRAMTARLAARVASETNHVGLPLDQFNDMVEEVVLRSDCKSLLPKMKGEKCKS